MSASAHSSAKQTAAHQSPHVHKEPASPSPAAHSPSSHAPPTAQKEREGRSDAPKSKAKKSQAVTRALGFWANQAQAGITEGNEQGASYLGINTKSKLPSSGKGKNKGHGHKNHKGGRYNVDTKKINHNRGWTRSRKDDPDSPPRRLDPSRIAQRKGGDDFQLSKESPIYSDDGKPICIAAAPQPCRINAGAYKMVNDIECVFVFTVNVSKKKPNDPGMASGWANIHDFENNEKLRSIQTTIKKKISSKRRDSDIKTNRKKWVVQPVPPPTQEFGELHTCKNQKEGRNVAKDYFAPKSSGYNSALLLLNLPGTDKTRFGVGADLISRGATFQQAKGTKAESVDLYECIENKHLVTRGLKSLYKKAKRPVTDEIIDLRRFTNRKKGKLKFLFGKITRPEVSGYESSYGWINRACLKEV